MFRGALKKRDNIVKKEEGRGNPGKLISLGKGVKRSDYGGNCRD